MSKLFKKAHEPSPAKLFSQKLEPNPSQAEPSLGSGATLKGILLNFSSHLFVVRCKYLQSELNGMVRELIYEAKYQISAGPVGP